MNIFFLLCDSAGSASAAFLNETHNTCIFYFTLSNPKKAAEEEDENETQPFFFRQQKFYVFYNALKSFSSFAFEGV